MSSAVRFLASAVKTTPRRPLVPNYQAVLEKVERLKEANIQVDSISKSIQELEANARSQRVVWRFNERKIEHGLKRDDPAHRRSYHLSLGITSAIMYFAPKASKRFS